MWLEMFRGFSEESIRYRFFTVIKDTPHEMRVRYCNIDYDREIAIVVELTRDGHKEILGVGRLPLEPGGTKGELAFIITDRWQGVGLGTKLVDHVLEVAKDMGVEEVYSFMLSDNYRAQALTRKMGFELTDLPDGTVRGTLKLHEARSPSGPTRGDRPPPPARTAPEGSGASVSPSPPDGPPAGSSGPSPSAAGPLRSAASEGPGAPSPAAS